MQPADPDRVAADLFAKFFGRVTLFAARRLGSRAIGEDVAQETLSRALAALREGKVHALEALPGFVFQTARHVCLQHARKERRETRALERFSRDAPSSADPSGDAALVSAERLTQLRAALGRLREADREILREAYEDWSSAEAIGTRLGLTPEAVRVRKHRALKRLGRLLAEEPTCNAERGSGTRS